jgi:2-phospho-L-lactate guanylyltransferase
MTTILVPCKDLSRGKSRLSPGLDAAARRSLCEMFLRRTLALAVGMVGAPGVRLLTSDPDAREVARGFGIPTIADEGGGLNAALRGARTGLIADATVVSVVILPIDLPCAREPSLRSVMDAAGDVVIVPDRDRHGTNVLRLSRAALGDFTFCYGANSFTAHRAAAERLGFSPAVIWDDDLAFDVDEPDDYRLWQARATRLKGAASA